MSSLELIVSATDARPFQLARIWIKRVDIVYILGLHACSNEHGYLCILILGYSQTLISIFFFFLFLWIGSKNRRRKGDCSGWWKYTLHHTTTTCMTTIIHKSIDMLLNIHPSHYKSSFLMSSVTGMLVFCWHQMPFQLELYLKTNITTVIILLIDFVNISKE